MESVRANLRQRSKSEVGTPNRNDRNPTRSKKAKEDGSIMEVRGLDPRDVCVRLRERIDEQ